MAGTGYHFSAKVVSFGKGQSAVHTAAYNARTQLEHNREGRLTRDYSEQGGLEFSGIFAPEGAPAWVHDREELWNRAEAAERQQKNGRPARNLTFSLPHELNAQQKEWLVKDFARECFVRRGMIADVNIHAPHEHGDSRNYHVHCMLTMRKLDGDDFAKLKAREWNGRAELEAWREKWAHMSARALERAGFTLEAQRWRNGHQTLAQQHAAARELGDHEFADRLNHEPTLHKGPTVAAMERRGIERDRGETARQIEERNELRAELARIEREILAAERTAERPQPEQEKVRTADPEEQQKRRRARFTEEVLAVWRASEGNGLDFIVQLQDNGLYLAQKDERLVAVRQSNGHVQDIAGSRYGQSARDIRASVAKALSEHAGLILPTVAECRAIIKERHAADRKAFELAQSTELSATQGDIRLCYVLTKGGKNFAQAFPQALEEKSIRLAHVTEHEAQLPGSLGLPFANKGELVAVNARGDVYRFNARTTGDGLANMQARLSEIDAARLPTATECVTERRTAHQERIAAERKAFELAHSTELSPTQGDIRLCYATTKGGKQLPQALENKGIILAHVTRSEAESSAMINRLFLSDETKAFAPPVLKEGELVAVNAHGNVYRFNARTTGDSRANMEARLGEVDRAELLTLSQAKEVLRDVQRQRAGEAGLLRVQRANERLAAAYPVPHPRPSWEAQPQKQTPAHDDRLRPEYPADRMQREARKQRERNAEREGERWQEKLKRDRQPVEKTLQEIKPDYRGILRRQAERERGDEGDRER